MLTTGSTPSYAPWMVDHFELVSLNQCRPTTALDITSLKSINTTCLLNFLVFVHCVGSPPFPLLLLDLAPGAHELLIVPANTNSGCDRRIGRTVEFTV